VGFREFVSGHVISEYVGGSNVLPRVARGSGGYNVYIGGCVDVGCGELS
jgi:hypothetical protein